MPLDQLESIHCGPKRAEDVKNCKDFSVDIAHGLLKNGQNMRAKTERKKKRQAEAPRGLTNDSITAT